MKSYECTKDKTHDRFIVVMEITYEEEQIYDAQGHLVDWADSDLDHEVDSKATGNDRCAVCGAPAKYISNVPRIDI